MVDEISMTKTNIDGRCTATSSTAKTTTTTRSGSRGQLSSGGRPTAHARVQPGNSPTTMTSESRSDDSKPVSVQFLQFMTSQPPREKTKTSLEDPKLEKRRQMARQRERDRVKHMKKAFQRLQDSMYFIPPKTPLSKIKALKFAIRYIGWLGYLLKQHKNGGDGAKPSSPGLTFSPGGLQLPILGLNPIPRLSPVSTTEAQDGLDLHLDISSDDDVTMDHDDTPSSPDSVDFPNFDLPWSPSMENLFAYNWWDTAAASS